MRKKVPFILFICVLAVVTFFGSYYLTLKNLNKTNKTPKDVRNTAQVNASNIIDASIIKENTVQSSAKIIFKTLYSKSGDIVIDKQQDKAGQLSGKSKKDVETMFSTDGYAIQHMDNDQVIFLRTYDKYSPNKYVLDIYKEGNCIAIFKTDKDGNESIEDPDNDIKSDMKIDNLKDGDIDALMKGNKDFQYNTKAEAEEGFNGIFKS